MRFNPISEQEADAQAAGIWDDGTYEYEVIEAEEKESNAGNEMTALTISIFNSEGGKRKVFDYLVATDGAAWKIRHFAASCGLLDEYEKGTLMANEMIGRTGKCIIGTQKAKDTYPAKNVVRDYVKVVGAASSRSSAPRAKTSVDDIDDEVPF
jgi:hypothetical protein